MVRRIEKMTARELLKNLSEVLADASPEEEPEIIFCDVTAGTSYVISELDTDENLIMLNGHGAP